MGKVWVQNQATASIYGAYTSEGETRLYSGTLNLGGSFAEQDAGSFILGPDTTVAISSPSHVLGIRDGSITGDGTVQGSLVLGYDPNPKGPIPANPAISPVGSGRDGTIHVTGNFQMFGGRMLIGVSGPEAPPGPGSYDRVQVDGSAALSPAAVVIGILNPAHKPIPDGTPPLKFLTFNGLINDFGIITLPDGILWPNSLVWDYGNSPTAAWFTNFGDVAGVNGRIGGKAWDDDAGVARGVFEPGVEAGLAGVPVRLFDGSGTTQIASTVTAFDGTYSFDNLPADVYTVEFDAPAGRRFSPQYATTDPTLDSDPDPQSGRVLVYLTNDINDLDAGLYSDANPIAVDDNFRAHRDTPVSGNVLANDTDEDGDPLTAALTTWPAHGGIDFNPDGSFTYTPDDGWAGTDSFYYTASDGYGGTATAVITIVVSDTPAPFGQSDSYSTPAGPLVVDAAGGVLHDDTAPNGGLTAVLASGPSHGTLTLNPDGSFVYQPDDDFIGVDWFRYYPTDADGPGNLTPVSIAVTDHPPQATDDSAMGYENSPVTIDVLANDTDPDPYPDDVLTLLGAADGLHGTTAANDDGTVTYTPDAYWYGTDSFVYAVMDGSGRVGYATVTVTVNKVDHPPVANDDQAATTVDTPVDIAVLANDTDPEGDQLTVIDWTQSEYMGTVSFSGGVATYTPPPGFYGTDSFSYTINDGSGGEATAVVTIDVGYPPSNNPPNAVDDTASTSAYTAVDIHVLANDTDPDGDRLWIVSNGPAAYGIVTISTDGTYFTYTPEGEYTGPDSFSYTITDGHGGYASAVVTINVGSGGGDVTIDGIAWYDANADGIQDNGEGGLAGVAVFLFDEMGQEIDSTVTDQDGRYSFSGLPGGTYSVRFRLPQGYAFAAKDQGSNDTLDSDVDPDTGMTDLFVLYSGDKLDHLDAGLYST